MSKAIIALIITGIMVISYKTVSEDPLLSMAVGLNNNQQSTRAFNDLLQSMQDMARLANQYPAASAESYRSLLHTLASALVHALEDDPERPEFKRSVTTTMKWLGDNPDAIYHSATVRGDRNYQIRGNMAGAKYLSLSAHDGKHDGSIEEKISAVITSDDITIDDDGRFSFFIGPDNNSQKNYLKLSKNTSSLIVRHYFEEKKPVAADLYRHVPLVITPLDDPGPAPAPTDSSIAASIDRANNYFRGHLEIFLRQGGKATPAFVSTQPNQFVKPVKPGTLALANTDAAYAQAPFVLTDKQALVISGRMPEVRMANVVLWNAYLQTFDYRHRQVSLNREQMVFEEDGRFTIIVAHQDPGHPNWLDTEGRNFGFIYWRFLLPTSDIEKMETLVVDFSELKQALKKDQISLSVAAG